MIWQHALAWFGALTVVLPIAIHLLGRGHAKVYRFPSLRFFRTSRLLPTRRTRIHDPLLLVLRAAILVLAAAALAQPLFGTSNPSARQGLVRAIIVDTSEGLPAASDSTARLITRLEREADASVVLRTETPSAAIPVGAAWLQRRSGRREIAIISAFPRGSVASLANVPSTVGVRLLRLATPARRAFDRGPVHVEIASDTSTIRWSRGPGGVPPAVRVFAPDSERAAANAMLAAAASIADASGWDSTRSVSIVLPSYARRTQLLAGPRVREPWMIDLLARLRQVPAVRQSDTTAKASLLVFCEVPAANVGCAAVVTDVIAAGSALHDLRALEPERIDDAALGRMQRVPGPGTDVQQRNDWLTGTSHARWLWALVVVLLGAEMLARRERAAAPGAENQVRRDRAA